MSVYYQSLLGLSTINGDDLNVDNINCKHFTFSDGSESDGYILTSDSEGNGTWKPDPNNTLAGDVSGALLSNSVNSVGGSSSANIHSSEVLANASTDSDIPSAIVRRDASGGFSAGNILANLIGNASSATLVTMAGDCVGGSSGNQVNSLRGGTVSIPSGTDTLVNLNGTQTLTNKTLTAPKMSTIVNGAATVTFPNVTDTLVGRATTDSLTNKTLVLPKINSLITNTGTLTMPGTTDTLVGRDSVTVLTNKTITGTTNTVEANSMRNGSTGIVPYSGSAPATNNVLTYNGTNAIWQAPAAVTGVSTATANALAQRDASAGCAFAALTSTTLTTSGLVSANNGLAVTNLSKLGSFSTFGSTSITVPTSTTSSNCVQFLQLNALNGGYTVELSVAVSSTSVSESAIYRVPVQYSATSNTWQILNPDKNSSTFGSYRVDFLSNGDTSQFRLVRVSGTVAGTANISARVLAGSDLTFTFESISSTDTTIPSVYDDGRSKVYTSNVSYSSPVTSSGTSGD